MLVERKYYRRFDPHDQTFPQPAENNKACEKEHLPEVSATSHVKNNNISLKADDLILLALIAVLLMEEEKDYITIGILAAVFLSEYLF
ncbi:MAG: hypothetical protein IJE10_08400 [Clostridia bacterium]|nr:hypothetical protein [Clostridia bacterium]